MKIQSLCIASVLILLSTSLAGAGTATFYGEVADQTCSVTVNGQISPVVNMPTVPLSDFFIDPDTAPRKSRSPFVVDIFDCPPAAEDTKIQVIFKGRAGSSNMLLNTGTAKYVDIRIRPDHSNTVWMSGASIPVPDGYEDATRGTYTQIILPKGATAVSHTFYAEYFGISRDMTPGTIEGSMQYVISYH